MLVIPDILADNAVTFAAVGGEGLVDGCGVSEIFRIGRYSRDSQSFTETEADCNGIVDLCHNGTVKVSHFFLQTALVESSDLLEQDHRIFCESDSIRADVDMGGKSCFSHTGGDRGGDHSRAVTVANIVLYNKYGSQSALLTSYNGTEICVKYITSSDVRQHFQTFLSFCCFSAADLPGKTLSVGNIFAAERGG